jgi:hypothetical protein
MWATGAPFPLIGDRSLTGANRLKPCLIIPLRIQADYSHLNLLSSPLIAVAFNGCVGFQLPSQTRLLSVGLLITFRVEKIESRKVASLATRLRLIADVMIGQPVTEWGFGWLYQTITATALVAISAGFATSSEVTAGQCLKSRIRSGK